MNFVFMNHGLRIGKDTGDKRAKTESIVIFRALAALNAGDYSRPWRRFYPCRHGLTESRIGIRNHKTGVIYWHERYAIEKANEAYNGGELYLSKA